MTKLWKNLLIGGFLASFVILLVFFNATKPRIMVLHSAAQDSSWARQVDAGMRESLARNRRPLTVEWHYLGLNPALTGRRADEARAAARRGTARFDPDLLIAVDDEANSLAAREYAGRGRPRILYLSLNRPPADFGYAGATNVSGIAELLPFAAVRDAIGDLFPGRASTVAILGVDNETGRAEMAQAHGFRWQPAVVRDSALVSTSEQWRGFVASNSADVLLVLGTRDLPDAGGRITTAAEIIRWTQENSPSLPIGTQVNFVEDGGGFSSRRPRTTRVPRRSNWLWTGWINAKRRVRRRPWSRIILRWR